MFILLHQTPSDKNFFSGYYGVSPFSMCESLHLSLQTSFINRMPKAIDHADIGVFDLSQKKLNFHKITETNAFNWQQGSRLQWINDKKFMFNVYDKSTNKYHAKVVSTTDYSIVDYSLPVQDSFDESYFLSLNYKRLATLKPEYGYHCHKPLSYDLLPKYKNDGIWKIDFDSGKSSLILSLSDVCQFFPKEQFNNSTHLINHIQINPSGENFIFLHRYTSKGKQTDRLISYNFKTKQMKLITVSNLVSHFYWQTNNSLVAYLEDDNKGRCYVHIDLETLDRKFISCLEVMVILVALAR